MIRRSRLGIVGGGFCGTALAAALLRRDFPGPIVLIEAGRIGPGLAYGTKHRNHVLNSPPSAMSAFSDDPEHFVRWLGDRGHTGPHVSRSLFGQYLAEIADDVMVHPNVEVVRGNAIAALRTETGFEVRVSGGTILETRDLVLATGNPPPGDAFLPDSLRDGSHYVPDPWHCDYGSISGDVLLVGSGLTALDVLVSLREAEFAGHVYVVSRHGHVPLPHAAHTKLDVPLDVAGSSATDLLRVARSYVRAFVLQGYDWRAVIDALRPNVNAMWQRLPERERRHFLRRAGSYWNIHRHRAPAPAYEAYEWFRHQGRLTHEVGTVRNAVELPGAVAVELATSNGVHVREVSTVVNCTGPLADYARSSNPLVRSLLASGEISKDPLELGLHVDDHLRAVSASGSLSDHLYVLGPAVRSRFFEGTAVPELRRLAETLAEHLVEQCAGVSA